MTLSKSTHGTFNPPQSSRQTFFLPRSTISIFSAAWVTKATKKLNNTKKVAFRSILISKRSEFGFVCMSFKLRTGLWSLLSAKVRENGS